MPFFVNGEWSGAGAREWDYPNAIVRSPVPPPGTVFDENVYVAMRDGIQQIFIDLNDRADIPHSCRFRRIPKTSSRILHSGAMPSNPGRPAFTLRTVMPTSSPKAVVPAIRRDSGAGSTKKSGQTAMISSNGSRSSRGAMATSG
jgi:hypothetical protein